jgi:hypothetical protein
MYLENKIKGSGFVAQESIDWQSFLATTYGKVYQ